MPSSVVPIGEIASIAADASGIIQSVAAGTATGGDMATAINTIFSIAQGVMNNPFTAAAAASTAGIQLAAEHSRLQQAIASGNNDAIVDATLGLVGAIGGLIAMAPLPQTRAIGAAIAIGTIAARDLYRNRESIAGVLGDVFNAAEVARVPIVWIDPQTAINRGLIESRADSNKSTRSLASMLSSAV